MDPQLNRDEIGRRLAAHRSDLLRLDVRSLRLFGSYARGTSSAASDIDFLVEFDGKATFDRFMDAKLFLEDLFGKRVDLVTPKALRPEMRPTIEREAVRVA